MQTLLLGAWQNFPKELAALLASATDGKAAVVERLMAGEGFGGAANNGSDASGRQAPAPVGDALEGFEVLHGIIPI